MHIGLVGLPQSGKTTLFNLLTGLNIPSGYSAAGELRTGSAELPDERIEFLASLYKPRKIVPARIAFHDIPGVRINEGGARAAALLDGVRAADLLVQVVRAFRGGGNEPGYTPDPYRDLADFATELFLADIDAVEKRMERIKSRSKIKKNDLEQLTVLERMLRVLEQEQNPAGVKLTPIEQEHLAGQAFLSAKPLLVVINIDEEQLAAADYPQREQVVDYAQQHGIPVISICAQTEMEISRFSPEESGEFRRALGLAEPGLKRLVRTAYDRLGLISFFTVGDDEVRAWTVRRGATARQAAGKIHSDLERGFIRAELFHFDDIHRLGSVSRVREAGLFRLEGKDYTVCDGDIINIRFNV